MKPVSFELLIDAIKSLPGIGKKSAERIAYFLIDQDQDYINELIKRTRDCCGKIVFCDQCNNFAEEKLCNICANRYRNQKKLCIVTNIEDLNKVEETNVFDGLYFVIKKEVDVKNNQSLPRETVQKLLTFFNKFFFDEVILANNLTINGEATAQFLKKIILGIGKDIKVYRIGFGLPINSSLDYADEISLKYSLKNKVLW